MDIHGLEWLISELPVFAGMAADHCELIAGCAKNVRFDEGEYLFREGDPANVFFLIRDGRIALELSADLRPLRFLTVSAGEIAGVSWLVPPHQWLFDAQAVVPTRALSVDARCLRGKCEDNHHFGYEMMKRLSTLLVQHLHAAQLQILEVYGAGR